MMCRNIATCNLQVKTFDVRNLSVNDLYWLQTEIKPRFCQPSENDFGHIHLKVYIKLPLTSKNCINEIGDSDVGDFMMVTDLRCW